MRLLEIGPDLVAPVERRETRDIDVGRLERVAVVLDRLLKSEPGEQVVALLDLRDLGVVEVDVESDDLNAGVERLLGNVFQRFRLSVGT